LEGNEHLLVGLTSSFGAVGFYRRLGFKKHKTAHAKVPGRLDLLGGVVADTANQRSWSNSPSQGGIAHCPAEGMWPVY